MVRTTGNNFYIKVRTFWEKVRIVSRKSIFRPFCGHISMHGSDLLANGPDLWMTNKQSSERWSGPFYRWSGPFWSDQNNNHKIQKMIFNIHFLSFWKIKSVITCQRKLYYDPMNKKWSLKQIFNNNKHDFWIKPFLSLFSTFLKQQRVEMTKFV